MNIDFYSNGNRNQQTTNSSNIHLCPMSSAGLGNEYVHWTYWNAIKTWKICWLISKLLNFYHNFMPNHLLIGNLFLLGYLNYWLIYWISKSDISSCIKGEKLEILCRSKYQMKIHRTVSMDRFWEFVLGNMFVWFVLINVAQFVFNPIALNHNNNNPLHRFQYNPLWIVIIIQSSIDFATKSHSSTHLRSL